MTDGYFDDFIVDGGYLKMIMGIVSPPSLLFLRP